LFALMKNMSVFPAAGYALIIFILDLPAIAG
jgi:hypothetical protein